MGDCCCGGSGCGPTPENEGKVSFENVYRTDSNVSFRERFSHFLVRLGVRRHSFFVEPGLYTLGNPSADDPVLVSANYKLTFDILRSSLAGRSLWLLILDTRGINVWCAAGKGTFGTKELIDKIEQTGLVDKINHRKIILPQLGAPGVEAHKVQEETGFRVFYGPVMARDIPAYLESGFKADSGMRRKRFPFKERIVLTPLELIQSWKLFGAMAAVSVLLSVLFPGSGGPGLISDLLPAVLAVMAGAFLTPLLLPWIPVRAFALKGAVAGAAVAAVFLMFVPSDPGRMLFIGAAVTGISSFMAMNFTGASTYTSLSGVVKEMRFAVPAQIVLVVIGVGGRILYEIMAGNL